NILAQVRSHGGVWREDEGSSLPALHTYAPVFERARRFHTAWTHCRHRRRQAEIGRPQLEATLLDHLWTSNLVLRRRFPNGVEPFKIISRLAEECGELSAEVQLWEDQGVKRAKHGDPDPHKLATEVMDVMRAALAIAEYYHVERE